MDRNSVLRIIVIAAVLLIGWKFLPTMCGQGSSQQTLPAENYVDSPDFVPEVFHWKDGETPPEGELCTLEGQRFRAVLSSRGAGLKAFELTDEQYKRSDARDV